jgi:cytochrome P450
VNETAVLTASHPDEVRALHAERYGDSTRPLDELVRMEDPAFYVNPWPVYARLQDEAPVHYQRSLNTWVVTRYDDVRTVARTPGTFSSAHGTLMLDGVRSGAGKQDLFAGGADFIGVTDPPRHAELRRVMTPPFIPPSLAALEPRLMDATGRLLDALEPDTAVEWVEGVAARLPVMAIAMILGIDPADQEFPLKARRWSNIVEDLAGKGLSLEEMAAARSVFTELDQFILALFDERRRVSGDDFLSSLLADSLDGRRLTEANLVGFTQALIAAGNDTVRALLSNLVALLAARPDQYALLRQRPGLASAAVEETLRFSPPARGFARQVVQDTVLCGQQLRAGQRVLMAFDAANRDPSVFADPNVFDLACPRERRNVAFGFGAHVCIAAPLARLEARILLEALSQRFGRIEMAGPGEAVESFLRNGWRSLPVRLIR